jgi:4-amino-4-deoxy-L-arabinose transferase-like glycosyltransferase
LTLNSRSKSRIEANRGDIAPLVIGLTLLAAVLRFPGLGILPPGLYHDEAYNGLDALSVLAGARPIFFEANNGREPLFIYLVAASVAWLGRTTVAVRAISALLGTLTVPATYLMGRVWFDRRTALLAALVMAVMVWPINLSRVGFRAVAMPLFVALTLWQLGLAFSTRRTAHFVAGGIFYGLLFYTYLAARSTPLALVAFVAILWLTRRPVPWRGLAIFALTTLLVGAPLLAYGLTHADEFLARSYQVSVFNPVINHGDLPGALLRHAWRTLLMFTVRGDFIPRHNVPLRPVFDPLMGLAFVLGLGVGLARWRQPGHALVLTWTVVMLLPTVLAEDAPHFLRAVGVLPVLFVVPAWGLGWIADCGLRIADCKLRNPKSKIQNPKSVRNLLSAICYLLVVTLSLAWTTHDYFWVHARSEAAYYQFETGAVELAGQVNRFLAERPGSRVYLARRLWDNWPSVRFLVAESPRLTVINPADPPAPGSPTDTLLVVWPFEDNQAALRLLPRDAEIRATAGAMEWGDLERQARRLFVTYQVTPGATPPGNVRANFDNRATLVGYQMQAAGPGLHVRLTWRADRPFDHDYTAFVHVIGPAGLAGQSDQLPAGGLYPTTRWRPGDLIVDEHHLVLPGPFDPASQRVEVGLYRLETGERLPVLGDGGTALGDYVELK